MLNLDEHFQVPDMIAERYTEYVDNDVDVDDVDDDEEGAGAYFFWSDTAMVIRTVNYIEWSA